MQNIDEIAKRSGGVASPNPREAKWPVWTTYIFQTGNLRKRFMSIIKGRYPGQVTLVET